MALEGARFEGLGQRMAYGRFCTGAPFSSTAGIHVVLHDSRDTANVRSIRSFPSSRCNITSQNVA